MYVHVLNYIIWNKSFNPLLIFSVTFYFFLLISSISYLQLSLSTEPRLKFTLDTLFCCCKSSEVRWLFPLLLNMLMYNVHVLHFLTCPLYYLNFHSNFMSIPELLPEVSWIKYACDDTMCWHCIESNATFLLHLHVHVCQ